MKVINVNKDSCIGCGACVAIDDAHFTFDSDGKSDVISHENLNSNELNNAIESCPTAAISLVDEENAEDNSKENETCECECDNCQGCHHNE